MRLSLLGAVGATVAALAVAVPASAGGVTAAQLTQAGWTCFPVPGLGIHCAQPGQASPPTGPTVQLVYFDDAGLELQGTETLVRDDIFQRRASLACPHEPTGGWFPLTLPTGTYWACHRS